MRSLSNSNRRIAGELFSKSLTELLIERYGYLPSAAKFSDAFNLRAYGTSTISRETARKWIRGEALPELSRLKVLIKWLGLKPSDFLEKDLTEEESKNPSSSESEKNLRNKIYSQLISLLSELDEKSIEALFLAALALREIKKSQSDTALDKKFL